jgi:hypothetical protein
MRSTMFFQVVLTAGIIFSAVAAHAAPPAFCRSYARGAVEAYEESRSNGCGLFGGRWQANIDAHYDWCLGTPAEAVEQEDEYRSRELRACRRSLPEPPPVIDQVRRSACRNYARVAVRQNEAQELLRCNFRGGRWQSNEINHFNWCVTVDRAAAEEHNANRDRDLRQCKRERDIVMQPDRPRFGFTIDLNFGDRPRPVAGPKARFCRNYAVEAVRQNDRQEELGCGFFGNRWRPRQEAHFTWCMSNQRRVTLREADRRRSAIEDCEDQNQE